MVDSRLDGAVAVVTGALAGVGSAIASGLQEAGAIVVGVDLEPRSHDADERVGNGVTYASGDVTNSERMEEIAEHVHHEHGSLDVWVNNAGVYPSAHILELSDSEWAHVIGVNLTGSMYGARAAARQMIAAGRGGVIVNIASAAAFRARASKLSAYAASKHGQIGLTRALAVDLGDYGIRVVSVAPTTMETPGTDQLQRDLGKDRLRDLSTNPLGRMCRPRDVADAVCFLASPQASFVTGSTLVLDGGKLSL